MYHSIADIIRQSEEKSCPFWQIVLQADMEERGVSYETSFATMRHMYQAMKAADAGYDPTIHSASGMAGGAGEKLHVYNAKGANLCGELVGQVMEKPSRWASPMPACIVSLQRLRRALAV